VIAISWADCSTGLSISIEKSPNASVFVTTEPKNIQERIMSNLDRTCFDRRSLLRAGLFGGTALAISAISRNALAEGAPLKIGIIGAGHIGSTIGSLWVQSGHPVMFSSRHPDELKPLVDALGSLAQAGTVAEAIDFGDVVFIAVPYGAYPQIATDFGSKLSGKVVIDAGNAVAARDGTDLTAETKAEGIGLTSAKLFPGAHIVRAFNSMSYKYFASEANRAGDRMAIPIAGDDKDALNIASTLVHDAGFDPVIIGSLARAKDFSQGNPLYGLQLTAAEMRQRVDALK
jgi:8-hydroxy-5-deazaflavin:NADPH oxidoreductase